MSGAEGVPRSKNKRNAVSGSAAIDWMVTRLQHLFPTREIASDVAQQLVQRRFMVSIACKCTASELCTCRFKDSSRALYILGDDASGEVVSLPDTDTSSAPSVARTLNMTDGVDQALEVSQSLPSLDFVARYLARRAPLDDRVLKFSPTSSKKYKSVASGRELVDFLLRIYVAHERYLAEKTVSHNEFRVGTPEHDVLKGDEAIHDHIDEKGYFHIFSCCVYFNNSFYSILQYLFLIYYIEAIETLQLLSCKLCLMQNCCFTLLTATSLSTDPSFFRSLCRLRSKVFESRRMKLTTTKPTPTTMSYCRKRLSRLRCLKQVSKHLLKR